MTSLLGVLLALLAGNESPPQTRGGGLHERNARGTLELPWTGPRLRISEASVDPAVESEALEWIPETVLRYDQEGAHCPGVSGQAPPAAQASRSASDDEKPLRVLREADPAPSGAASTLQSTVIRGFMEPLDYLFGFQSFQASWEKGMSDLSIGTSLSDWIDSMGCPIGTHSVVCLNFDMLGFDEAEGENRVILDSRHATARLGYLLTSFGVTLKF